MLNANNFNPEVEVASPGRINLIGEHIDYNGGHVLPAAINKKINLKFRRNGTAKGQILSSKFNSSFSIDLNDVRPSDTSWHNYILGVIFHINKKTKNGIKGFDCIIQSDLPLGAGISSSAALECGIATGLNALFDLHLSDLDIINISRDAEHTFVGTKCGIMDQFSVVKSKKDHLLLLNCESLEYDLIPSKFDPYAVVLLNTNVEHSLATSAYNKRREECQLALETIQKKYPEIPHLTEVSEEILNEFKNQLSETVYNRALFVTQENARTLKAVDHLKHNNLNAFGELMYQSHFGLKDLYEVSCPELDFLVEATKNREAVIGSRLMGGGFGGCTINLVNKSEIETFVEDLSALYKKQFNLDLTAINTTTSDGVTILS